MTVRLALFSLLIAWLAGTPVMAKPALGRPELVAPVVVDGRVEGELWVFPRATPEEFAIEAAPLLKILEAYLPEDALGLLAARTRAAGTLSLTDLEASGLSAQFDEASLELHLRIPLRSRQAWFLDLNRLRSAGPELRSSPTSGYLNLRATQNYLSGAGVQESKAPLNGRADLVQQVLGFVFETGGTYLEHAENPWTRQDTRLVLDWEERLVRATLGDLTPTSRGFQIAPQLGGVSVRREFSIRPERTATRITDTEILIKRDSVVQFWVNGALYSEVRLPAGRFNLREFPLLAGFNKVEVRIRDDLGQEEKFDFDLLFDGNLLENGVHEFSYGFGFPSRPVGGDRAYDGQAVFSSIVHRMGVSDVLTVGVNFQNWFYRGMAGVEASRATKLGLFTAEGALSSILGVIGGAGRLRWRSPDRIEGIDPSWRLGAEFERRADSFFPVTPDALTPANIETRADAQLSRRVGERAIVGLGVFEEQAFFNGIDRRGVRGNLMIPLPRQWRAELSYQRAESDVIDERGMVTLSWSDLPGRLSMSASHESSSSASTVLLNRTNAKAVDDGRWTLSALSSPSASSVGLSGEYLTAPAALRLDHLSSEAAGLRQSTTGVGVDTAVVWADGVTTVSQPVGDAFVLIQSREIPPGHRIRVNPNGEFSRGELTAARDRAVLAELSSYSVYDVNLDSTELPPGYRLEREWFRVRPGYRSGLLIRQDLERRVSVKGRLVRAGGEPWALIGGEIEDAEGRLVDNAFFTNRDGRFVIEALAPGRYKVTFGAEGTADWLFEVPAQDAPVELGDVRLPAAGGER